MTTTMSERIKQIRKGKDISQEEFGNKIGITRSSVCLNLEEIIHQSRP